MKNKPCRHCGYYVPTGGVYSKSSTIGWCGLYHGSVLSNFKACSRYRNDYEELLQRTQSISLIIGLLINKNGNQNNKQ